MVIKTFELDYCTHTRKTANQNSVYNKNRVLIGRFWKMRYKNHTAKFHDCKARFLIICDIIDSDF